MSSTYAVGCNVGNVGNVELRSDALADADGVDPTSHYDQNSDHDAGKRSLAG